MKSGIKFRSGYPKFQVLIHCAHLMHLILCKYLIFMLVEDPFGVTSQDDFLLTLCNSTLNYSLGARILWRQMTNYFNTYARLLAYMIRDFFNYGNVPG